MDEYEEKYIELLVATRSDRGNATKNFRLFREHQQEITSKFGNDVLASLQNKYGE